MKRHAISSDTPKNIPLGAGIVVKNLVFDYVLTSDTVIVSGKTYYTRSGTSPNYTYTPVQNPTASALNTYYEAGWTYDELGASNGGNKFSYEREYIDLEVDGKTVKVEGFDVKVAETAKITFNLAEYKKETIATALSLVVDSSAAVAGFTKYKPSKTNSYVDNLGFVGFTAEGKEVIIKFPKAICLSAYEVEAKNKEQGSFALEFDAVADDAASSFEELGIEFYFPTASI